MNTTSQLVLAGLLVLTLVVIGTSVNILLRGSIYRWLKPASRPRRWVLVALLLLFAVFAVWFPIWMAWPDTIIAKALTLTFGVAFCIVGFTLRWFTRVVDAFVVRKGWPLR